MEDTQEVPITEPLPPDPKPAQFDRSKHLTLNLKRAKKSITVRFPSDEELIKRERSMRTFYRKGSSLPEFEGLEEANLELAQAIHTGGDAVDEETAGRIAEIVLRAVPELPERTPEGYSIALNVVKGIRTAHVLREPTEKQVRKYRESAIWMGDMKFQRQEAKTVLGAVGDFYDKLCVGVSGYSGGKESVPVVHKSVAVNALLTQIREEQEQDEVDPEVF